MDAGRGRSSWSPVFLSSAQVGRPKQSPRTRRALSKPRRSQRPSSGLTVSSQVNHESESPWSPHTADYNPSPDAEWRQNLSRQYRFRDSDPVVHDSAAANVAVAYNQAGGDYVAYADGDPTHLFAFNGLHAYADRRIWTVLEAKLIDLRATGASSIRILDAGCGPGTWLRRLVTCAHVLGFSTITARGFDVARVQVQRARLLARDLSGISGVNLTFDVADLTGELPEADASVDLTLCLYSVLSHLPVASLPRISAEVARVTSGHFITTVRSVGSTPTIFVDSIEKARHFKHDKAETSAKSSFAFTSLPHPNCGAISLTISTLRICAASTFFIIASRPTLGGTLYPWRSTTSFPMNSSGSRRPTLLALDSWNAPPTSCSWARRQK
jgi:SAM-dependent methyltransferase